ncbi:nitrate reductase [Frigidibacter oleivorans]|uniref:nitrate reductase n=1 Tax=Frigidibacter oleivorans TaxID=2487129 RepID=UPI000F8EFD4D|nr:nitrate reductase [Frigidibacter oleivorans]
MTATRTTCPYCGVGCGVLATPDGAGGAAVAGDPDHPANRGRLCVKGAALGETLGLAGRLLHPTIGGREVGWDAALDEVAGRFSRTIAEHGPDSVALYVSGQLLTEDYYVANKLMKGLVGSANIDTNSRLCMASAVAGHRRAFGSDTVPGQYEDLDQAELVVLVGSNLAWCHPVLYQRLAAARAARPGMRVVVIDPRRTATCDIADMHLAPAPGSDAVLFNHLLAVLADRGLLAAAGRVSGLDTALAAARASDPALTGLHPADLAAFTDLWARTDKVVTVWSQGINQSDSGTDKVNAILNCHIATGRIGRPGMGPFSVTGQPNAMGGREVGGLANMLACHLQIEDPAHRAAVQTFWQAPRMAAGPGLKAVDLFDAVGAGRIRALWILCTNPVASMPEADRVARAIAGCEFTVVSDVVETDTTLLADVVLPALGWGEKDGTVTNSERRISRQRAFLPAPGEARPDWWALAQVGRRMGWAEGFAFDGPAAIFREHAALSGMAAGLGSDFDISRHAGIDRAGYDALQPFLWPAPAGEATAPERFFGDGRYHTPDGRARAVAVAPRLPAPLPQDRPFRLNTGRVRDQWHTMTRTGLAPRLALHRGEPFLEVHPADAARLGLEPDMLAELGDGEGRRILRVLVSDAVAPGHPFAPIHWTDGHASAARIGTLVPGQVDPVSGQPALKSAPVAIRPFRAAWYGYAVSAGPMRPDCAYWAGAVLPGGAQMELAGEDHPADWGAWAARLFGLPAADVSLSDPARGLHRLAFLADGRLVAALFVARTPVALSRALVAGALGQPGAAALAGRAGADRPDPGPTVCACFSVGAADLARAIAGRRLMTVEAIGAALRAGTNCGSCRPEIRALIDRHRPKEAAE